MYTLSFPRSDADHSSLTNLKSLALKFLVLLAYDAGPKPQKTVCLKPRLMTLQSLHPSAAAAATSDHSNPAIKHFLKKQKSRVIIGFSTTARLARKGGEYY